MSLTAAFATTAQSVVALAIADATTIASLSDDSLLAAHALLTAHRRHADTLAARFAGELDRRSSRDAGYSGLAQRRGFGSAESLLPAVSPVSKVEATQLIQAGALMVSAQTTLWESALSQALASGSVAVAAAAAIRTALAPAADSASASELLAECEQLLRRVAVASLDELRREARSARDRLDEAGIARREKQRYDGRYLKRWVRDDGMYQGAFLLNPKAVSGCSARSTRSLPLGVVSASSRRRLLREPMLSLLTPALTISSWPMRSSTRFDSQSMPTRADCSALADRRCALSSRSRR